MGSAIAPPLVLLCLDHPPGVGGERCPSPPPPLMPGASGGVPTPGGTPQPERTSGAPALQAPGGGGGARGGQPPLLSASRVHCDGPIPHRPPPPPPLPQRRRRLRNGGVLDTDRSSMAFYAPGASPLGSQLGRGFLLKKAGGTADASPLSASPLASPLGRDFPDKPPARAAGAADRASDAADAAAGARDAAKAPERGRRQSVAPPPSPSQWMRKTESLLKSFGRQLSEKDTKSEAAQPLVDSYEFGGRSGDVSPATAEGAGDGAPEAPRGGAGDAAGGVDGRWGGADRWLGVGGGKGAPPPTPANKNMRS